MTITKKELLEKARAAGVSHVAEMDLEKVVVRTARALGYLVLDEPELPERLMVGGVETTAILEDKGINPLLAHPVLARMQRAEGAEQLAAELVLRYNAKAEVMEVVRSLESKDATVRDAVNAAHRLRAAYEEKS